MSLSTMTNDLGRQGSKQTIVAQAYGHAPQESQTADTRASKAYDAIAKFIPTEVLAPYVVAMQMVAKDTVPWSAANVFWFFVILTPVLLVLFEFAKAAEQDLAWPAISQVLWRGIAATIAFIVWSFSVPESPFLPGNLAVAGMMAVLISPILAALDSIVMKLLAIRAEDLVD